MYTVNTKIKYDSKSPSWILQISHYFPSIAARTIKFCVFSSVFDFQQFWLYIANLKIQHGSWQPSWISKLPITFIPLHLESPNLMSIHQYLTCDNSGKYKIAYCKYKKPMELAHTASLHSDRPVVHMPISICDPSIIVFIFIYSLLLFGFFCAGTPREHKTVQNNKMDNFFKRWGGKTNSFCKE